MNELLLEIGELRLSVVLQSRDVEPPGGLYLDWLHCHVSATIRSFSGSFLWNVMPMELVSLADRLAKLYDEFPNHGRIEFRGAEPNVSLTFEVGSRGQVEVTFDLRDDFMNATTLRGSFETDQNVLQEASKKLRRFIQSATVVPYNQALKR